MQSCTGRRSTHCGLMFSGLAALCSWAAGPLAGLAHGQSTFYYGGGTKTWSTTSSWWMDYAGTQAAVAAPGASDTAVFNISGQNASGAAVFTGPRSLGEMQILSTATGALTLRGGGADQTLTLGGGGIRAQTTNASTFTLGSTTANQGLDVALAASQQWRFGNSLLTLHDQIRGSAGPDASQTLLIQTTSTATAAISAANAVFADGVNNGRLNLWFNTPGAITLSSANQLTGTVTLQSTAAGDGPPALNAVSLSTVSALQLAGGAVSGTVSLSGTGIVNVLGGASNVLYRQLLANVGTLQRPVGGGLLSVTQMTGSTGLRGVTNVTLVNGLLPWGSVPDTGGGMATINAGNFAAATLTHLDNINNITGTTGNWTLTSSTTQTLTKNVSPSGLQLTKSPLTTVLSLSLGQYTLESNAILFRGDYAAAASSGTISASAGGGIKIGSSGELVLTARVSHITVSAPVVGDGWLTLGILNHYNGIKDGSFTLSGSNSHTGGTSIVSRGLNLNNAYALGSGTLRIGGNAIVLDNTSGAAITIATNNLNEWNSDFSFGGTNDLNLGTGTVSLGTWAGSWRTITANGTATLTVGGPVVDGSYADLPTTGLVKSGSGVLVLAGNNAYTGGTEFGGGFLSVTSDANLGAASAPLIFNGGALRVAGTSLASLSTSRSVSALGDQPFWFDVAEPGHSFTVSQNLSSQAAGGLRKTGAGLLALTGVSTFTGAPAIDKGVVSVATLAASGQASPLGSGSQVNLGAADTAGTLRYTGGTPATLDRLVNLAGAGGIDAAGVGALTVTGSVAGGTGVKTFTLTGTSTALNTIGTISGTGVSVVKDGTGLWRMNAATKGFGGTLTVKQGVLQMATAGAAGTTVALGDTAADSSGVAAFLLEQGVTASPSFNVAATAGAQAALIGGANTSGTATFSSGEIRMSRDVALVAATGGTVDFSSTWAGATTGSPATRNVTIGAAGYTGRALLNNAGTLATTGSVSVQYGTAVLGFDTVVSSAGTLAVGSGATLGGAGFVTGAIGGAGLVSPGNSPGILTAGSLDPSGGTDFIFEITGSTPSFGNRDASVNDVLRLTDPTAPFASALGAGNVVNVLFNLSGTPVEQGTFKGGFFTDLNTSFFANISSGSFAYWVSGTYGSAGDQQPFAVGLDGALVTYSRLGAFDPALSVQRSVVSQSANFGAGDVSGQITQFVVVPEPMTLALAGIGSALVAWRVLRRRG